MGRGFEFTCHTCRIVYDIGYGSYGGTVEPQEGDSLANFKKRAEGNDLANTARYAEVMEQHEGHKWDTLEPEFCMGDEYEDGRRAYTQIDLQKRDDDAWKAYRHRIWNEAERIVHAQPDITAPALLVLLKEKHPDTDEYEDTIKSWITTINNKKRGLPKELERKLSNWMARTKQKTVKAEHG